MSDKHKKTPAVIKEIKIKYHFPLTKLATVMKKSATINQRTAVGYRNVSWLFSGGTWAIFNKI